MYVCQTLVALVKIEIAIMASTVTVSTVSSCCRIPTSSALRSRNGWRIAMPAETTISTSTAASRSR